MYYINRWEAKEKEKERKITNMLVQKNMNINDNSKSRLY